MARPDPFLNLLRGIGFLPLRVPRADVEPLMLASHSGKELVLLGNLADALEPGGGAAPPVSRDLATADSIEQMCTSRIRLRAGLQIVGNILTGIAGKLIDLSHGFEGAESLVLEFSGVTVDRADLVMVDRYLGRARIHADSRHVRGLLMEGKGAVVTATARCRRYMISAQSKDGTAIELDVPLLREAAGGLRVDQASGSRVSYEGPVPVTFGVQAARVFFDREGRFTAFRPVKPGQAAVRGLVAAARQAEMVSVNGVFVDVVDGLEDLAA